MPQNLNAPPIPTLCRHSYQKAIMPYQHLVMIRKRDVRRIIRYHRTTANEWFDMANNPTHSLNMRAHDWRRGMLSLNFATRAERLYAQLSTNKPNLP